MKNLIKFFVRLINVNELVILKYYKLTNLVLKNIPPFLLIKISNLKFVLAINYYQYNVPAYKSFLVTFKKAPKLMWHSATAKQYLPVMDKKNYIYNYSIADKCINGVLPSSGSIDESAGTEGNPTVWVRSLKEEKKLEMILMFALNHLHKASKRKDLIVLNCWSLGPWTTGVRFSTVAENVAIVKSIGTDIENTIKTFKNFGTKYRYLLCGYPPFVKEILDYGTQQGINWKKYKLSIQTGGEGFTESWRNYIRSIIGIKPGSGYDVYSAYGASDIDIGISFETNLAVGIRQLINSNEDLREELLGDGQRPIYLGQYNPLFYYIELINGHNLAFTTLNFDSAMPKIRYHLGDAGGVLTYGKVKKVLKKYYGKNITNLYKNSIKLPFLFLYGRSDGTISLDGANIYPQEIQDAFLEDRKLKPVHAFMLEVGYTENKDMIFVLNVELDQNIKLSIDARNELMHRVESSILKYLLKNNHDYKESYLNNKKCLTPHVRSFDFNEGPFEVKKIKNRYILKN